MTPEHVATHFLKQENHDKVLKSVSNYNVSELKQIAQLIGMPYVTERQHKEHLYYDSLMHVK